MKNDVVYVASGIGANSRVRVKIRPKAFAEMFPDPEEWRPDVDEDGYSEWSFWDLVWHLGPVMRWGAMVLDGDIEVEKSRTHDEGMEGKTINVDYDFKQRNRRNPELDL